MIRPKPGSRIYLATPYSHKLESVRQERFNLVTFIAGSLLKQGYLVFSPITHCHPIALAYQLPAVYTYWRKLDLEMLDWADVFVLVRSRGWDKSKGVRDEFNYARRKGKPTYKISLELPAPILFPLRNLKP